METLTTLVQLLDSVKRNSGTFHRLINNTDHILFDSQGDQYRSILHQVSLLTNQLCKSDISIYGTNGMSLQFQQLRDLYNNYGLPTWIILGAGPKALTDLCLSYELRENGYFAPLVLILESHIPGANREGSNGYSSVNTQHDRPLNISMYKDISQGECMFGKHIQMALHKYSRSAFDIASGIREDNLNTSSFNNHNYLAKYCQWIVDQFPHQCIVGAMIQKCKIEKLNWKVYYGYKSKTFHFFASHFVKTGAGSPYIPDYFVGDMDDIQCRDSQSMYQKIHQLGNISDKKIAIIGGGTAAEDILKFCESYHPTRCDVISRNPLYQVTDTWLYNYKSFSTTLDWCTYTTHSKHIVERQTDVGVFTTQGLKVFERNPDRCFSIVGSINSVVKSDDSLLVTITNNIATHTYKYDIVCFCCGLIQEPQLLSLFGREILEKLNIVYTPHLLDSWIDDHIPISQSFGGNDKPTLILPMHSTRWGIGKPGLGNLLGSACDRMFPCVLNCNLYQETNCIHIIKEGNIGKGLQASIDIPKGTICVKGYPLIFTMQRTSYSVQVGLYQHVEPSHVFRSCNSIFCIQDVNVTPINNDYGMYDLIATRDICAGEYLHRDYRATEQQSLLFANNGLPPGFCDMSLDEKEQFLQAQNYHIANYLLYYYGDIDHRKYISSSSTISSSNHYT